MMTLSRKGFTLVEIMIVVAIIALLAAIAIPNLLTARRSANESQAQANLKSFATASEAYAVDDGAGEYAGTANNLIGAGYFGYNLNGLTKGGYDFTVEYSPNGYTATADSPSLNTGRNDYQITTGAVLGRRPWNDDGGAYTPF